MNQEEQENITGQMALTGQAMQTAAQAAQASQQAVTTQYYTQEQDRSLAETQL